jgi:hypothetical protein
MALSPNYGWAEPDNSSLVKNGAQDIRALGDAIDTSLWNVGFGQAGKNKIINGDFGIWQRGTSFSAYNAYWADRWTATGDRTSPSFTRQTFTPASAPVAGYEAEYYARWVPGSSGSFSNIQQRIEDVRTFAAQSVTLSYWARISTGTILNEPFIIQNFGSGGSGEVSTALTTNTITTTWTRYTHSFTVPTISGKTLGAGSYLGILPLRFTTASTANIDIWGVQVEYGSKATPFETATGTLQGELSLCQRYYWRVSPGNSGVISTFGTAKSTTAAVFSITCPTTMRKGPDTLDYSNIVIYDGVTGQVVSALTLGATFASTGTIISFDATSTSLTQYRPYFLYTNNANGFFGVSAEL